MWKTENPRAASAVAFLLEAFEHPGVQPAHQRVKLRRKRSRGLPVHRLLVRERDAPHLGATLLRQLVEVLGKAGDQIALGHHQIHRQLDVQLLIELDQPAARRFDLDLAAAVALEQQILCADREDDAIDRTTAPVLAQQREKLTPGRTVGRRIRILGGIAPGRVEEHRFVGEPPVAIAGAANALQRALAHPLLQWKLQPRIEERRRLARAGGTDEHVPGQVVQAVATPPLLLERRNGLFEPFAELHDLRGSPALLGMRLTEDRRDQLVARATRTPTPQGRRRNPKDSDKPNRDQP